MGKDLSYPDAKIKIMTILELANEIKGSLSSLLSAEVSIAFVKDKVGIIYIDDKLLEFEQFITTFSSENFKLLNVYDHSLPLSGTKLGFFKTSPTALIVIHSHGTGPVGQILVFKSRIDLFADRIDEALLNAKGRVKLEEKALEESIPPSAQRIPIIEDKYRKKKYTMEEATVIHNINGKRTIAEICKITEIPLVRVDEIISKYEKKKYIKLKEIASDLIPPQEESPIESKEVQPISQIPQEPKGINLLGALEDKEGGSADVAVPFFDKLPKGEKSELEQINDDISEIAAVPFFDKISPKDHEAEFEEEYQKLSLEHPIKEIFHIFDFSISKAGKNEYFYLELCDGRHTIEDIIEISKIDRNELFKLFKKYQKKDGLRLLRFISEDQINLEPIESVSTVKKQKPKKEGVSTIPSVTEKFVDDEEILQSLSEEISELDIDAEELDELNLPKGEEESEPLEPLELPQAEEEPLLPMEEDELDVDLEKLTAELERTELDNEDKVEDTISELSSLIDEPSTSEEEEQVVFEDALSELDQLIDEATEAVSDVEPIEIEDYSSHILQETPLENSTSVNQDNKQDNEGYQVPIPAEETPIEAIYSNEVTCGNCGEVFPSSKRLCPSCKKPAMLCPNCGQPVAIIAKICPYCTSLISK